jgi:hypothetical protein
LACCAFAVFLLGQLVAALAWLRRHLPRPLRPAATATLESDPVTSWQLFPSSPDLAPATGAGRPARGLRGALLFAAGLELAILGVGALGLAASRGHPQPGGGADRVSDGVTSFWCRSLFAPGASARGR